MTWPRNWTRAAPTEFYSEEAPIIGGAKAQGRKLDGIFKRHLDHVECGRNEKNNSDETSGDAGGVLGHTQPFVKSVGGAESSQEDSIQVSN